MIRLLERKKTPHLYHRFGSDHPTHIFSCFFMCLILIDVEGGLNALILAVILIPGACMSPAHIREAGGWILQG